MLQDDVEMEEGSEPPALRRSHRSQVLRKHEANYAQQPAQEVTGMPFVTYRPYATICSDCLVNPVRNGLHGFASLRL